MKVSGNMAGVTFDAGSFLLSLFCCLGYPGWPGKKRAWNLTNGKPPARAGPAGLGKNHKILPPVSKCAFSR
jgi:hypothetical protein